MEKEKEKNDKGKVVYHLKNLAIYQSANVDENDSALKKFSIHVSIDDYNEAFWRLFSSDLVPAIHPTGSVPRFESDSREKGGVISFSAESVVSLYDHLKKQSMLLHYNQASHLMMNAYTFIENLEKKNFGITCFDISDFIVINGQYYVFVNDGKIVELDNNDRVLVIDEPIQKGEFMSPELKNLTRIPTRIPKTSTLFSLGSFVGTMLTGERLQEEGTKDKKSNDMDSDFIYNIYYTKLYWCIKRCVERNPKDRGYIYI